MTESTPDLIERARGAPNAIVIDRAYRRLLRAFFDAVGADRAALVARNGDAPQLLSMWERDQESVPWVPESSLIDLAFEADQAILHPPLAPENGNGGDAGCVVSALAAPVRTGGVPVGAIYAGFSRPPSRPLNELRWFADAYAGLAALCMAGDHGLAQVVGSGARDALTGCLDYAVVMEMLSGELERARRHGHALSCLFLDLDGFKEVNDSLGHLEGNRVLAATGVALRRNARGYDTVGRFGGDEFVVVLPETGARSARAVAERLRGAVSASIMRTTDLNVGVSVGIARWIEEKSAEELLDTADRALSRAKENGGAQVVVGTLGEGLVDLPELPTQIFKGDARGPGAGAGGVAPGAGGAALGRGSAPPSRATAHNGGVRVRRRDPES